MTDLNSMQKIDSIFLAVLPLTIVDQEPFFTIFTDDT